VDLVGLFLGGVDREGLVGMVAFPDFEGLLGGVAFLGMAFGFLPWLVSSSSVLTTDPGVDSVEDRCNPMILVCTMRLLTNSWCFEIVVSLV
jgi:hypothetical protein